MDKQPIGLNITSQVLARLSSLSAQADEEKALLPPVVAVSIEQYQATHQRGFVLCQRVQSPFGYSYIEQVAMRQAPLPESVLTTLTRSLERYDPEHEAVLIILTPNAVRQIDIGTEGPDLITDIPHRSTGTPPAPEDILSEVKSDLMQAFRAYVGAATDGEARAILETHPDLLTDPDVDKAWQLLWMQSPTASPRLTNRHKLWKRKRKQHTRKAGQAARGTDHAPFDPEDIQWQPISQLPDLAAMIDTMYTDDQEQHRLYLEARQKPHVLDDATVNRAMRLYKERLEMIDTLFGPQFARWQADPLTDDQRREVDRLVARLTDLKALDAKILALLNEIKTGTIDAVLRKSDAELGFDSLYGNVPLTDKQRQLAQKIDTWIKGIERRRGGDEAILQGMADYMTPFKQVMDSASRPQMDKLCAIYPGFYRFAKLLEDLARGIHDGVIDVPR